MPEHRVGAEPVVLEQVDPAGNAVDVRVIPRNREGDGRVEQDIEVVGVGRVFVEVPEVGHDPSAERLLHADLHLVARARLQGYTPPCAPKSGFARPFEPVVLDTRRFSLYGVSMVRPYDARSTGPHAARRTRSPAAAPRALRWSTRRSDRGEVRA